MKKEEEEEDRVSVSEYEDFLSIYGFIELFVLESAVNAGQTEVGTDGVQCLMRLHIRERPVQ